MKIIIIDCQNLNSTFTEVSNFAKNIQRYLEEFKTTSKIIKLEDFLKDPLEDVHIILSGSFVDIWSPNIHIENLIKYLKKESMNIKQRYIIGICFGAQMIAKAIDDNSLSRFKKPNNQIHKVDIKGFKSSGNFAFIHQDFIKKSTLGLNVLSSNKFCDEEYIEVFNLVNNQNIYGIQFHPEINKKSLNLLCLEFNINYNEANIKTLIKNEFLYKILSKSFDS